MINDTLYAKYIKARENMEIIESEKGFITYGISGKELFLRDIFIDENFRRSGVLLGLVNDLIKIGKDAGCDFISANIHLTDKHCTKTLRAAFAMGFQLLKAQHDILLIGKDIKGEGK